VGVAVAAAANKVVEIAVAKAEPPNLKEAVAVAPHAGSPVVVAGQAATLLNRIL